MLHPLRSIVAVCALSLMCSAALAQELVDNPIYQSWAKFKPQTTVTMSNDTKMGGMGMKLDMIYKLTELTPEKAVVEITVKMPQGDNTSTVDILAKMKKQDVADAAMPSNLKGDVKVLPDEDVKIGDKTYKCKVIEFATETHGIKGTGKTWTCPDIPGQTVKMETTTDGPVKGTALIIVTAIDAK